MNIHGNLLFYFCQIIVICTMLEKRVSKRHITENYAFCVKQIMYKTGKIRVKNTILYFIS